jgi:hypothetical protein
MDASHARQRCQRASAEVLPATQTGRGVPPSLIDWDTQRQDVVATLDMSGLLFSEGMLVRWHDHGCVRYSSITVLALQL